MCLKMQRIQVGNGQIVKCFIHHTNNVTYVTGCTGLLGGLVGSLTYAIHCKRLWSMPALILGSSGIRW